MIISHQHKFIFIAIPKTGTTSIETALDPLAQPCMLTGAKESVDYHNLSKHDKLNQVKNIINIDGYFSFCFVRNPWARHLGTYFYYHKMIKFWDENPQKKTKWKGVYNAYLKTLSGCDAYPDWVKKIHSQGWAECDSWEPCQFSWASEIDFIGRVENLQEDFNTVCDKIGIPHQQLPHKNKSSHKHYTEYYDDETREIVAQKYAQDIERFGYEFGED